MKQKTIQLYDFEELSDEAKERALNDYNENNDYLFLEDYLNEYLNELLEEAEIKTDNSKLFYSLGYCQGDGICFEGNFEYKGFNISVGHQGNYYHKNSVFIEVENPNDDEDDDLKTDLSEILTDEIEAKFQAIYNEICDKIEKAGYEEIEYNQSEENFKELCEANEYTFRATGEMDNF